MWDSRYDYTRQFLPQKLLRLEIFFFLAAPWNLLPELELAPTAPWNLLLEPEPTSAAPQNLFLEPEAALAEPTVVPAAAPEPAPGV